MRPIYHQKAIFLCYRPDIITNKFYFPTLKMQYDTQKREKTTTKYSICPKYSDTLTLVLLKMDISCYENTVDPDQLTKPFQDLQCFQFHN